MVRVAHLTTAVFVCHMANGFLQSSSKFYARSMKRVFGVSHRQPIHLNYAAGSNVTDAVKFDHGIINSKSNDRFKIAPNGAQITMIGSGPGTPDLLTVAAHRLLTSPDNIGKSKKLIISDRLVSQEILDLCVGEVRIAKKYPGCAEMAQEEIYQWVQEGISIGRHVVRLKIGDPFVFGRGGEEVLKFREMGMEPTVVPGVSAAFSAPLLGGIPVTHRGVSNQVVMCTGYGRNGTSPELIQYHKEQTVVFLMAVGRLQQLMDNLCNLAGYPRDTPVGIVERAGCPDQRTLVGDMSTIASLAEQHVIKAPSTIIVGDVVPVLMQDLVEPLKGEKCGVQGLVNVLNFQDVVME